jgi:hypothetical protein
MYKLLIVCILFCLTANISAQSLATLQGKVIEPSEKKCIANANIEIRKNGILELQTETDLEGYYSVNLDAGTYEMSVTKKDWNADYIVGIILNSGRITKVNAELKMISNLTLTPSVVRHFKVPLVELDNTTSSTILSSEQLRYNTWYNYNRSF